MSEYYLRMLSVRLCIIINYNSALINHKNTGGIGCLEKQLKIAGNN